MARPLRITRVHAYGLMDSRYHLLLQTPRVNLSEIMHHINGADTTYFSVKRALARSIQMYLCQNMRA